MSQEGANQPQEVEGSHDQATAPHGSIPASVGTSTQTMMPAGSISSSISKLASAVNNTGSIECASPAVLSGSEDINASSKIASLEVLQGGEDSNATSKIASPAELLAGEENKAKFKLASPIVLLAGEKGNDAGPKLASPAMLQDRDNSKAGSHAGVDNATRSELASPVVLHAGIGNNDGSKITSPAVPRAIVDSPVVLHAADEHNNARDSSKAGSHAGVDNATRSELASPVVLHAGDGNNDGSKIASPAVPRAIVDSPAVLHAVDEHNNARFKVSNPAVLHTNKDMDNNPERLAGLALLHAGEDNNAKTKLTIQPVSHADGNAESSRLTRSAAAACHAAKDTASKLTIEVVPHPYAGKDNNAGSSKAVTRPTMVDASESNVKEGKNNVVGEQQPAHEVDLGRGSRKGSAAAVEDADPNLHIFTERERRKKMKNMFSTLHALLPQLPNKADKATIVGEAVTYIKTLEGTLQNLEKRKMERNRALAAQQHHGQQQLVVGAGSSSRTLSARHPALPALPAPAPAASSREANLADMVHGWEAQVAQQAAVAAASRALVTAVVTAGAGGSSSAALPRGAVPFPAPAGVFQTWTGQNAVVSVANNEAYINLHFPREPGMLTKALFVLERNHIEVITTTISTLDGFRMYGIHARANPASASARFPENLCAEDRFKLAVSEMLHLINL